MSKEFVLKMLEMAILETQIFKHFWGSMPPDSPPKAYAYGSRDASPTPSKSFFCPWSVTQDKV